MRVKLPSRPSLHHYNLQVDDSSQTPRSKMGLGSKAASCRNLLSFRTHNNTSSSGSNEAFDTKHSNTNKSAAPFPSPVSTTTTSSSSNESSRGLRSLRKMSPKQMSMRNLFTLREDAPSMSPRHRPVIPPPPPILESSKEANATPQETTTTKPSSSRTNRVILIPDAEGSFPVHSRPPQRTSTMAPPPMLTRTQSLPAVQAGARRRSSSSKISSSLNKPQQPQQQQQQQHKEHSLKMKESIRQLDAYLATSSTTSNSNSAGSPSFNKLREVSPIHCKPKLPMRNPYANLSNLAPTGRLLHHSESSSLLCPAPPALLSRHSSGNGLTYCLPPAVKTTTTKATTTAGTMVSASPPSTTADAASTTHSLACLTQAYKQIMVDFDDESSETTTGW